MRRCLLEYNNYITHVVSQNQFIVPGHSAMIRLVLVLVLVR